MGVMIGTTVVVAILTLIGTAIWWAMMNDWEAKDRKARGRHVNDRPAHGDAPGRDDDGDGPIVMKL